MWFSLFYLLLLTVIPYSSGNCLDKGIMIKNNTQWNRDSCTSCSCTDGMVTCERQTCADPQCDTTMGESLIVPANRCCPVCALAPRRHCQLNGETVAHGTRWDGSNCSRCACDDGEVDCSPTTCPSLECGYGETERRVPGSCCPLCVSVAASCSFQGRTYRDGEMWSPSKCEKAVCSNGEVLLHVARCDKLVCGPGETQVVMKDECCPTCVGRSCIHQGREYESGESFEVDDCEQCLCENGQVKCKRKDCVQKADSLDVSCPDGQERVRRDGVCCPHCVATQGSCQYDGSTHYHGELWNISKCQVAFCSHGNVRSSTVQCTPVQCKWNEKRIHTSCCPECVQVTAACSHNGFSYRDGDAWQAGACERCSCVHGVVQCFSVQCPLCPVGTIPQEVPGECCPDCQPVTCHSDCVSCDAPGYGHCTSCKQGRLLQLGKCVRRCLPGYYQEGVRCRACHSSCATCSLGSSPSSCTSCRPGSLLQEGRCVSSCHAGFYASEDACSACRKGCESCLNSTSCQSCVDKTRLPQGGACVKSCSEGFFFEKGLCTACHDSCATCSDGSSCRTCPSGHVMEEGLCRESCSAGYFQLSITRCAECHRTCATCTGSSASNCVTCNPGSYLHNGRCVAHCPTSHFAQHGTCQRCHASCQSCTGASADHCTLCASSSHVIQTRDSNSSRGTCVEACRSSYYLDGLVCKPCHKSCGTCMGPASCSSCKFRTDVLTVTSRSVGDCITNRQCRGRGLNVDATYGICYNGTATSTCHLDSKFLDGGNCVAECPSNSFALRLTAGTLCLPCGEGCSSCQSSDRCERCAGGKFLSQLAHKCVSACEPGYYASVGTGTCEPCPSSCSTCVASDSSPQPVCTSCRDVTAVLQHGHCSTTCIQQFYVDHAAAHQGTAVCRECDWSCLRCAGPTSRDCLECMPDHKLENGTCVLTCSRGFYQSSTECLPCSDDRCSSCTTRGQCSSCRTPYFVHDNKCVTSCPRGYFGDVITRSCASCPAHCLACDDATSCTQCNAHTFLMQGLEHTDNTGSRRNSQHESSTCVRHCGHGYYANKKSRVCEVNRYAPSLTIAGRLLVGFGSRALVEVLRASDLDGRRDDVSVVLEMVPANGWFEVDNTKIPAGERIPYEKVRNGALWFVHDSSQQRHGVAAFRATDGQLSSEQKSLDIAVVSKSPPVVVRNDPLIVSVGQSAKLGGLVVTDEDNAYDVTVSIVYGPVYGSLVKLPNYETAIKSFEIGDLQKSVIYYAARSDLPTSGVLYDSVTLQISDKYHVINTVLRVTILPESDFSPVLINKKMTRVVKGQMSRITNHQLQLIGSNIKDKSKIVFVLNPETTPKSGEILLMVPELSDAPHRYGIDVADWMQTSQGYYRSQPVIRFSQRDVDEGSVWYRYVGDEEEEEEEQYAALEFEVYDESGDVAEHLVSDQLQMAVVNENNHPPRLARGVTSPPQMSVNEGRITILHSGYLHYTDDDTPDRNIIYNITRSLSHEYGSIEHADHPYVPITVFTQGDVDSNKIMYRPPIGGIRSVSANRNGEGYRGNMFEYGRYQALTSAASAGVGKPHLDFEFTVSDGKHVLPPVNFTIKLTSGASQGPTFVNQYPTIQVTVGGTANIGVEQLAVRDPDTQPRDLIFALVKSARHGTVVRNVEGSRTILEEGEAFTYYEVQHNNLQYIHDGSDSPSNDQLQVSVTDVTHTLTKVIQVEVVEGDSAGPYPDPYCELSFVLPEATDVTLSREHLAYMDQTSSDDQIVFRLESVPRNGLLESHDSEPLVPGSTFTQEDINQSKIRFTSRGDIGSESLSDVIHFTVSDSSGNELTDQVLSITINPALTQPPTVHVNQLVVEDGHEVMLTTHEILATDVDTPAEDLVVRIVRKPKLGRIINTLTEESLRVAEEEDVWFSVRDLVDGGIYYIPIQSVVLEDTNDFLTFRVTDGVTSSSTFRLNITLHATPKTAARGIPRVLTSAVECRNGHAVIIRNVSLSVYDADTPNEQLVFTVMSELEFGKLVKFAEKQAANMPTEWEVGSMMMKKQGMGMKKAVIDLALGSTFTYQDILDRKICYETTDPNDVTISRRRRDTLDFTLSDGSNVENGELEFDLEPIVQHKIHVLEPPERQEILDYEEFMAIEFVLEANTGLTVERGSTTVITSENLRVSSTGEVVSYVVTRNPNVGQLQLVKDNVIRNISASGLREFKQSDIDNGHLRYFHPLTQGGGDVFFMFDVISGMIDLRFNIHVNEDRTPPRILVNNGLTVKEGGSATILTQHLSATDDSGRLQYQITQQPKFGRLEFSSEPGVIIESFNQDDIVSEVVKYVHTGESERSEDQFNFVLTDGSNAIMQSFYITVIPVDNSLPVLVNQGIRVQEGVRKTITSYELRAEDQDTASESITFNIVTPPQNGAVERTTNGRHYVSVTSFTMQDLYESRISYNHDGTNSIRDSFTFTVTDGTNEEFQISEEESLVTTTQPQTFLVKVVPVDDGTPRLITNVGLRHLEYMDDKMMNSITKSALLTEDPDTPPDLITYALTSEPRHGHLESTLNSGHKIRSFTQADINMGLIRYVLTDLPSDETRDSFMFNVRDSLPNVVTGNTFNIRWSVISFDKDNYTVNEESKTVDITVQRRGNLNEYAIVLCRTEQGTATSATGGRQSQAGAVDYMDHAAQVQFDEHATEKICSIQINDDETYEGVESFTVELTIPAYSLLGNITRTTVYINDDHDMPTLQFVETQYTVEERDTTVFIPIKRTGDIEKALSVICYTESNTATGSLLDRIQSGSDFKSRGRHSGDSIVTFAPGVSSTTCDVKIIDDSIYEDSEDFKVYIVEASQGSKIGKFSEATVTITGPNDAPTVFLTDRRFVFNENAGVIDIPIKRSGSDLSRPTDVWCSTKQTDPTSAIAGEDFVATSTKITFRDDETTKICSLTLLDDSQSPTVEGNETFIVYLNSVQKGRLISPSEALIVINDTLDDVPKFEFTESSVTAKESDGVVSLAVRRSGDTSGEASVICYTRQGTAVVDDDFVERSFTETSRLVFAAGQTLSYCNISLVDDAIYEASEGFSVRLANAMSDGWYGARVGENNQVQVTIFNDEDAPTLEFERVEYSIREPDSNDGTRLLTVRIVRSGDVSEVSKVRCSTRDGSAKSGSDYEPKSRLLRFQPGQNSVTFKVNILSNEDTEWHETFLIKLGPNDPVNAVIGEKSQATVTILDKDAAGSLVLPSTPIVVSLLHYDDVATGIKSDPSPGYPLICVTPCDPKYPNYVDTRSLCEEAAINASAIKFKWEVAMPTEEANGVPPFETITDNTPFTSVDTKVLDSIYFGRRFNIRCVAQAVDSVTHTAGTPLVSKVVTIGTDSGLCHSSIVSGSPRNFQAQNFIANLRYVPADAEEHPNTVHISIKIPHQDGRLPLISTMPFSNVVLLLSRSIDQSQHVCSNLGNPSEDEEAGLGKSLGFITKTDYSKLSFGPGYDKPYQFDPTIREPRTIDLYKYLNLKSCTWQFDTYYEVNELIDYCHGKVDPDYQLRGAAQSQITVTVPLYVSYVYVLAPRGWGSISHFTDMQFSFRYQNILWRQGIRTDGAPSGALRVLQIKADKDGRLVLEFETHAKFRGQYVLKHRTLPNRVSRVIAPEGMNIDFTLTNIFSESTYDSPNQRWRAVSTFSKTDYTGNYVVELLPCTVLPTQKWLATPPGKDASCSAVSPESFDIQLEFQQANRPVPVVYTLKTLFQLCNNEKVFMTDPQTYDDNISDLDYTGTYTKGQTIFGRVLWQPNQDLRSAYHLQLEKVYLCTGKDGSVPYFDPTGELYENGPQYGCIEPNKNLQHRFLLLDRSNRGGEDRYFHDVPFDASFASDRSEFASMRDIPGVDGFLIKVDALYKVEAGHQWYIQVVYVISPDNAMPRVKRSALFSLESTSLRRRRRRSANSQPAASFNVGWLDGESRQNGTNMRGIRIEEAQLEPSVNVVAVAGAVGAVLLLLAVAVTCCLCTAKRRRLRRKERDLEMIQRKQSAAETDDERHAAKMVAIDKYAEDDDDEHDKNYRLNKVRVSNVNLNVCETPLLKTASGPARPNNKKGVGRPLLHNRRAQLDIQIVNNLKDDGSESGTEV